MEGDAGKISSIRLQPYSAIVLFFVLEWMIVVSEYERYIAQSIGQSVDNMHIFQLCSDS